MVWDVEGVDLFPQDLGVVVIGGNRVKPLVHDIPSDVAADDAYRLPTQFSDDAHEVRSGHRQRGAAKP